MPGRPGGRRALRGVVMTLFGLGVLAGAGHTFVWLWLTGALTVGFSDWVTQQRARGWEVEHALPERAGWPFAARLTVPEFRLAGSTAALPQGFTWQAGRIALTIAPPHVERLSITAEGPQRLTSGALLLPYTAERLRILLPLDPVPPARPTEFLLEGLQASGPEGPVSAARILAVISPGGSGMEAGLTLHLTASHIVLPPGQAAHPFGRTIESATADAVLTGPPPSPIPMTAVERAEAWRDAGGRLELQDVALRWGPLIGALRMTLHLDDGLQPEGDGRLVLERPAEAVGAAAAARMIDPRAATGALAMLALLTRVPEGGGAPQVDVPVTLERGTLSLARIPLLRVPRVAWPRTTPRIL
ncbi:DUF2125 domain-containing protein [Neoroseomonas alba]|nr:DUF2125 domain-containing protein [Neoroseomonas alba]